MLEPGTHDRAGNAVQCEMSEAEREWLAEELRKLRETIERSVRSISTQIEDLRDDLGLPFRQPGD
jgi:hypothetical protein